MKKLIACALVALFALSMSAVALAGGAPTKTANQIPQGVLQLLR